VNLPLLAVLLLPVVALPWLPGSASLVKVYREDAVSGARARIESLASVHPRIRTVALAHLALGVTSSSRKDYDRAGAALKAAQTGSPRSKIRVYYLASARLQAKDEAGIPRSWTVSDAAHCLAPCGTRYSARGQGVTDLQNPAEAVRICAALRRLPSPTPNLTLATAYEAASDRSMRGLLSACLFLAIPIRTLPYVLRRDSFAEQRHGRGVSAARPDRS